MKIKLYGIGNEKDYSFIIVEKNANFLRWLANFLDKGFDYRGDVETKETGVGVNCEPQAKNIEEYVDKHETYKMYHNRNKDMRVDVFYGKDRVFITIYANDNAWKDILEETTEFGK